MFLLILGTMTVLIVSVKAIVYLGGRGIRIGPGYTTDPSAVEWPGVAVIIPVAGNSPALEKGLRSILEQDYPDYQVLLVTRDTEDTAVPVIEGIRRDCPSSRHVIAGPSERCGQKNTNLLAGVGAAGENPEILVFCDSNRLAPPSFLKALIRPLVVGKSLISSGYHHARPGSSNVFAWAHAFIVQALFITRGIPSLMQPWGGAMAIRRSSFIALKVAELWETNVVDDVSLAMKLKDMGVRVVSAPAAVLETPLERESWSSLIQWVTRQIIYLKFCFPGDWLGAGLLILAVTFSMFCALAWAIAWPLGFVSTPAGIAGFAFLFFVGLLGAEVRGLHPKPPSWPVWMAAVPIAVTAAAVGHILTWFERYIHWRGTSYRVAWSGRVEKVERKG